MTVPALAEETAVEPLVFIAFMQRCNPPHHHEVEKDNQKGRLNAVSGLVIFGILIMWEAPGSDLILFRLIFQSFCRIDVVDPCRHGLRDTAG